MSGRLILWNNDVEQIKGTCEAEGFRDLLELGSVWTTIAAADNDKDKKPSGGTPSAINISLAHGPWVADFQQRLYHGKTLGTVTLTEIEQVDGNGKTWKKVREITLTEAWMTTMSHTWNGAASAVDFIVEYTDYTFGHSDKVSNFDRRER